MIQEKNFWSRLFDLSNHIFILLVVVTALLPLAHVVAVSFSEASAASGGLVSFWPVGFDLRSYQVIFSTPTIYRAFAITIARTVLGTLICLFITVITAYTLSKSSKVLKGRNIFIWLFM